MIKNKKTENWHAQIRKGIISATNLRTAFLKRNIENE